MSRQLDPYAEAAIVALQARNKKKKAEAAKKKKTEAAQKKAEAAEKKRAEAAEKNQAGAAEKNEGTGTMPDITQRPAMPPDTTDGSNPAPVPFLRGIIYTQQKKHKFRGLRVKGDRYTEASCTWNSKRSRSEAWDIVTEAISKHATKT